MSEQLTLQVLKTSTDKKYLSKSVNEIVEKKCRLKEGSSIVNPVVILKNCLILILDNLTMLILKSGVDIIL